MSTKKNFQDEVKYLRGIIDKQSEVIDKALSERNILRSYFQSPREVAECANMVRRYFDSIDSAFIGGYEKAILDIMRSLNINPVMYPTTKDLEDIAKVVMDLVNEE